MRTGGMPMRLLVACALAVAPALAFAKGPGIKAGDDLLIHVMARAGGGFDSNAFRDPDNAEDPANSTGTVNLGAGLQLTNPNPNKLLVNLDANAGFRFYAGFDSEADPTPVPDEAVPNGLSDANTRLRLGILPRSSFSVDVVEELRYSQNPAAETVEAGFKKIDNSVGPDLVFRPGSNPGARALEMRLGYRLNTTRFLEERETGSGRYNRDGHQIRFDTLWKFFPKTALVLRVTQRINDFEEDQDVSPTSRDAKPFQAQTGLRGLVTRRLSAVALVGYANTFNAAGESFSGVTASAQLQYSWEPTLALTLGYDRDASTSGYSNFAVTDRISTRAELHFLRRWHASGQFGVDLQDHSLDGSPQINGATVKRDDLVYRAGADLSFDIMEWLSTGIEWELEILDSTQEDVSGGSVDPQFEVSYTRQEFLAFVQAHY